MTNNNELIGCVSHDCAACKKQADALEDLQAEVAQATALKHLLYIARQERDAALARLAEVEKQEPVGYVLSCGDLTLSIIRQKGYYNDQEMALFAAAGASPQPSRAASGLRSLLGAALGALRYHTEQTRPLDRTKETIKAIERDLFENEILAPQPSPAQDISGEAMRDAANALEWHYARGYPEQPTDEPRKRDARALLRLKAAINTKETK